MSIKPSYAAWQSKACVKSPQNEVLIHVKGVRLTGPIIIEF